jgi:hypothetical protein
VLGVSCWLPDWTSVHPDTQMIRSDKATTIEYHDRLVWLYCVIAVFLFPLPWQVRSLWANPINQAQHG